MARVARPIGDLDLHLFGEGTHRRLWELLGPQPLEVDPDGVGRAIRFAVWAPHARSAAVVGDWNDWRPEPLSPIESATGPTGIWSAVAPAARSGHRYRFELVTAEGRTLRKADPMARRAERPPSDASVVPTAADHDWRDDDWMATRHRARTGAGPLCIYEVHLGSWRRGVVTWDDLGDRLGEHVTDLGFTHVELLPIAEHPPGGSRAYHVSGYYAPTARFGDPDGFRRFVDSMHAIGIGVILDWVPAHFPRDEAGLARFDGTALYERVDAGATGATCEFDVGDDQVRNFLVANALYWCDQFHVDGLRVDALSSMLGHPDGVDFVRRANAVVAEEFPDVLVVSPRTLAGSGIPSATAPIAAGGLGFSHAWTRRWSEDALAFFAHDPADRRHHRELVVGATVVDGERLVLPLDHAEVLDGRGSLLYRMGGTDPQRFAALRTLLSWQWSLPGAPLVFMGTEVAPWQEWSDQSEVPWHLLDHAAHRGVRDLIAELGAVSARWPALWRRDDDPDALQWLDDGADGVFAFVRWDVGGDAAVVVVANVGPEPRAGYRVGLPWGGAWHVVLDTDAARWWGSGHRGAIDDGDDVAHGVDDPWQTMGSSTTLDVGPVSTVWLAAPAPR